MERVRKIRYVVLEHSWIRKIVGPTFIENMLDYSHHEMEHTLERSLQLYPDMKVLKLFGVNRYLYHKSLSEEDLSAAVEMKRNYIRMVKGRANRVGHNLEATAKWFIDKFTTGARFWT